MKRLTQIMAMVAMALCTLTLTGCTDDDEYRAYTLEGTWKGDMYVTSTITVSLMMPHTQNCVS